MIAVPPLGVLHLGWLLEGVAGMALDATLTAAVHRRTSGNPLLAQEILAAQAAHGGLDDANAVASVVPASTRALVAERLAGLSQGTRSVLAAAAAVGTSFPLDVLAEVLGRDDQDVLDALAGR